jgi:hypothetical protein
MFSRVSSFSQVDGANEKLGKVLLFKVGFLHPDHHPTLRAAEIHLHSWIISGAYAAAEVSRNLATDPSLWPTPICIFGFCPSAPGWS